MRDYFVYLPQQPPGNIWGCTATSVGLARVKPHTKYPPARHPADHHFEWSHGRILQCYQIIFISEGSGIFESEHTSEPQVVESGTVLILFPGVWHRYAPDSAAGWTEHWIECQGHIFDEAVRTGIVEPTQPILHTGLEPDLLRVLRALPRTCNSGRTGEPAPPFNDGSSSAIGDRLPARRSAIRPPHR